MSKYAKGESVGSSLADLTARFQKTSETPGLDAQVLLAHVLDRPRAWVMAHPEASLAEAPSRALGALLLRLEAGEPLPYVLGSWEFFGLELEVTPDVLIPRPETELLVETALDWLHQHPDRRLAADIGTGSGCIAVALACHIPDLTVLATDISPVALQVACRNAARHQVEGRVTCLCSDLIPEDERGFDLIVANLPYIPSRTLQGLRIYGREPNLALDGGADGLDLIRRLLALVPDRLDAGGMLLLEIEASQGPAVLSLAYDAFGDGQIHLHQDLSGHDRLLEVLV
ncbi:MAG: peptide chain release factor N(5)-glutamine methyltransferase [Anaerolineales bacterium]|jgi:release factor glutamine methyltransferase